MEWLNIQNRRLARLLRNSRGNVAMTFALAAFPLFAAAGAAIDYGRLTQTQTRLQAAADAVALALAQEYDARAPKDQMRRIAEGLFKQAADVSSLESWSIDYSYDTDKSTVTVTADAKIDTSILALFRIEDMDVKVQSTSTYSVGNVEIVLVLDNTGSMGWSDKLNQLKIASRNFISALQNSAAGKAGRAKIAIVPFAVTVKVGTEHSSAAWIAGGGQPASWPGCVGDRVAPYSDSNDLPVAGVATSLYPPDSAYCSVAKILPLTSDWNAANARIDNMVANGATNVPIGLAWGWNMLTKDAPLSESSGASEKNQRVLVLLTDGENTASTLGGISIDRLMEDTCTQIKADEVIVFSVRVIDGNADLIRRCASEDANFFNVDNAAMIDNVFKKIMQSISRLRLSS